MLLIIMCKLWIKIYDIYAMGCYGSPQRNLNTVKFQHQGCQHKSEIWKLLSMRIVCLV